MINVKLMALLAIVALAGIGLAVLAMPQTPEALAQDNMTAGNQTGNMTDAGSGNISGVFDVG